MIKVVQAKLEDIEKLVPLFDAYRVFYKKNSDPEAAKAFLESRIKNKESIVYLVFEGEVAVGFTQLYPLFSSTRMRRVWLLNDLFVDFAYRGKGFSKLLLNAAKTLARETNAVGVALETEKSNLVGNQLYPATDFELDKEHNHYFWINK